MKASLSTTFIRAPQKLPVAPKGFPHILKAFPRIIKERHTFFAASVKDPQILKACLLVYRQRKPRTPLFNLQGLRGFYHYPPNA